MPHRPPSIEGKNDADRDFGAYLMRVEEIGIEHVGGNSKFESTVVRNDVNPASRFVANRRVVSDNGVR